MYAQEAPQYAYWTRIPNLYDDSDLDPYQMRLLVHIARRGVCWESDRALARHCRMSLGQVNKTRRWLAKTGWIEPATDPKTGRAGLRVVEKWHENTARYAREQPNRYAAGENAGRSAVEASSAEPRSGEYPLCESCSEEERSCSDSRMQSPERRSQGEQKCSRDERNRSCGERHLKKIPEEEPSKKRGTGRKTPLPPQAQIFQDYGGRFPSGKLRTGRTKKETAIEYMQQVIPKDPGSLAFWGRVVENYCLQWSSRSYRTMIDEYFLHRRLPAGRNFSPSGSSPTRGSQPTAEEVLAMLEAFR
jgi:hypothetical protein